MKRGKWEYISRIFTTSEMKCYNIEKYLNDMGLEGWELVQIIEDKLVKEPSVTCKYTFYFKRVK